MSDYGHVDLAESPYRVGNTVLIRTVTYFWVGTIVEISEAECLLRDAGWVADTGRFSRALATGVLEEVEPVPPKEIVSIRSSSIIDVVRWNHPLPKEAK